MVMPAKKGGYFAGNKKKGVAYKGKKVGKGKEAPFDDEAFERDLLLAIEESKRLAGLANEQAQANEQRIAQ